MVLKSTPQFIFLWVGVLRGAESSACTVSLRLVPLGLFACLPLFSVFSVGGAAVSLL